ncbi:Homocysteine S-methyltransferase protein [Rutstroemia sp. NJR-2017a WRK4]|nr:Homocysteine S-methyltransferase protein [Rutstroemia sp. NJR-2017a WRK4]
MAHPSPSPPVLLLDGGLGTTLEANHSCHFTQETPLWSAQLLIPSYHPHDGSPPGPEVLLSAQKSFVAAGADVLLTATYSASFEGFGRSGFDVGTRQKSGKDREVVERWMRGAVDIAYEAISSAGVRTKKQIALSLGAYGAIMSPSQEYAGKYDAEHQGVEQLRDWHRERIDVFRAEESCWGKVDVLSFETLPLRVEVRGVRRVMGDLSSGSEGSEKRFWISCVFPGLEGDERWRLSDGSTVPQVVDAMLGRREGEAVPWGIGLNCTKVEKVENLVLEFEKEVRKLLDSGEIAEWPALVIYPDGTTRGEVYNTTTKVWEVKERGDEKDDGQERSWDEEMEGIVRRARERGFWREILVGGCCKTTPVEIEKLRGRIDGLFE